MTLGSNGFEIISLRVHSPMAATCRQYQLKGGVQLFFLFPYSAAEVQLTDEGYHIMFLVVRWIKH